MTSLFGGGDAPKPDPAIAEAGRRNAAIGQEWINFAKGIYDEGKSRVSDIDNTSDAVATGRLKTADAANDSYLRIMDRYQHLFEPVQDRIVQDANTWDSADNQDAAAAKAKADVLREAGASRGANVRQMAAYGISPASGRFQGADRATALDTGLATVGAQNNARDTLKMQAQQLRSQAAQLGLNTANVAGAVDNTAGNAGTQAMSAKLNANTAKMQNDNVLSGAFSGAMSGNNSSANILNSQYQNELTKYNSDEQNKANMAGSAATAVAAYF